MTAMREHGIEPIDMVVVNLYPFEQTIARDGTTLDEAIEQIDIGGPSMIRSASKNWQSVAVVVSPDYYSRVLDELRKNSGATTLATRAWLAREAFRRTADYDQVISKYLDDEAAKAEPATRPAASATEDTVLTPDSRLQTPDSRLQTLKPSITLGLEKVSDLRYGENPHQHAALYKTGVNEGVAFAEPLSGKEMSFNNYVDVDAAWQLVCDFDTLACAVIKHTNPAGVGLGSTPEEAYRRALATDPISAFGGIVAFNRSIDEAAARAVTEIFTEVVAAPGFLANALDVLRAKKNLRVLRMCAPQPDDELAYRQISGGMLVQTPDLHRLDESELKVVTKRAPSDEEIRALLFAWTVCKHTKSNAIVYANHLQTVGVGAGQMSRVDSVRIGAMRAKLPLEGSVLASDAYFPFRDGLDEAAKHGVKAVIQPGGSVRDSEVILAADEHGMAMVFTGIRHFKH
jgi:phosphoribosylaminoimidazolecarboxamide formyltransferase/IMP cyclohydrolase